MGGDIEFGSCLSLVAGTDYFHLDAAALLGPGAVPQQRLPEVGAAHAAGHPRQAVYAPAYSALQPGAVLRQPAAIRHTNERHSVHAGRGDRKSTRLNSSH